MPAGLGYALRPLEAIAIVKFAIMLVLAPPPCWGPAYLVRSPPGAKRVLRAAPGGRERTVVRSSGSQES